MLEKTFEEWLRYRDECLRRMASEPYPAGTRLCPARVAHGAHRARAGVCPSSSIPCSGHPRRDLHISHGTPRAGIPWGLRLLWGTWAHFRVASAPSKVLDDQARCGCATSS